MLQMEQLMSVDHEIMTDAILCAFDWMGHSGLPVTLSSLGVRVTVVGNYAKGVDETAPEVQGRAASLGLDPTQFTTAGEYLLQLLPNGGRISLVHSIRRSVDVKDYWGDQRASAEDEENEDAVRSPHPFVHQASSGCQHAKVYVLRFASRFASPSGTSRVRVVVTSANLSPLEWAHSSQNVWWQDFFPSSPADPRAPTIPMSAHCPGGSAGSSVGATFSGGGASARFSTSASSGTVLYCEPVFGDFGHALRSFLRDSGVRDSVCEQLLGDVDLSCACVDLVGSRRGWWALRDHAPEPNGVLLRSLSADLEKGLEKDCGSSTTAALDERVHAFLHESVSPSHSPLHTAFYAPVSSPDALCHDKAVLDALSSSGTLLHPALSQCVAHLRVRSLRHAQELVRTRLQFALAACAVAAVREGVVNEAAAAALAPAFAQEHALRNAHPTRVSWDAASPDFAQTGVLFQGSSMGRYNAKVLLEWLASFNGCARVSDLDAWITKGMNDALPQLRPNSDRGFATNFADERAPFAHVWPTLLKCAQVTTWGAFLHLTPKNADLARWARRGVLLRYEPREPPVVGDSASDKSAGTPEAGPREVALSHAKMVFPLRRDVGGGGAASAAVAAAPPAALSVARDWLLTGSANPTTPAWGTGLANSQGKLAYQVLNEEAGVLFPPVWRLHLPLWLVSRLEAADARAFAGAAAAAARASLPAPPANVADAFFDDEGEEEEDGSGFGGEDPAQLLPSLWGASGGGRAVAHSVLSQATEMDEEEQPPLAATLSPLFSTLDAAVDNLRSVLRLLRRAPSDAPPPSFPIAFKTPSPQDSLRYRDTADHPTSPEAPYQKPGGRTEGDMDNFVALLLRLRCGFEVLPTTSRSTERRAFVPAFDRGRDPDLYNQQQKTISDALSCKSDDEWVKAFEEWIRFFPA